MWSERGNRPSVLRMLLLAGALAAAVGAACSQSSSNNGAPVLTDQEVAENRAFSASTDCRTCHPRQFEEWRSSPHAYTGISPTFYSLVAAGQNSGAGVSDTPGVNLLDNAGSSVAGAVGNFCQPCHSPLAFIGTQGSYGGNNGGFAGVEPTYPFVCAPNSPINALEPCTAQTSAADCGAAGLCSQFEGRSCVNMPPVTPGLDFPRVLVHCDSDSDCTGGPCPPGQDCGPCVIAPSAIYYQQEAQEGINCEACHNALPNHQRACQLFRNSDSVGVLSVDIAERDNAAGQRLRLGPYPVDGTAAGLEEFRANDTLPLVANAFHDSARVDTPLVVPYALTDRAIQPDNSLGVPDTTPNIVSPTALSCDELPYCRAGLCEGGPSLGGPCSSDFDCGGCGNGVCGPGGPRATLACVNSVDCNMPADPNQTLMARAIADGTLGPLNSRPIASPGLPGAAPGTEIDRADANYYRSSMFCGACHDVRPGFANTILRSCQLQKSQVCSTDADCLNLGIGCAGDDCGPCVAENNTSPAITADAGAVGADTLGDPRNTNYRRVENLFSEWQISLYNHPEMKFCENNSFRACSNDADCGADGPCDVNDPPVYGKVITCQDCHMSNFPRTPLIQADGVTVNDKNDLYPQDLAAVEGSQSNPAVPIPVRRVSTHQMPGVDLPLVPFPGQARQIAERQDLVDAAFKIEVDATPAVATAGMPFEAEVIIENVGVGHRVPAGFSHERQYWVQLYVQEADELGGLDPFDPQAPCNRIQDTQAVGADDTRHPAGAAALEAAGCLYRSGFILDKGHPETDEMHPDGSFEDEDPEDFFVVTGTRVRGGAGDPRIEVQPGAEGRALVIQNICAEATEEAYEEGIENGSRGIDMGTDPGFPYQARICDPTRTPAPDGSFDSALSEGVTRPGYGNLDCMEGGEDVGPCVPEIELSDGNDRGRCAGDLTLGLCQSDAECGDAGPCLFRCTRFPELECCAPGDPACDAFYASIGLGDSSESCLLESEDPTFAHICVGGPRSGLGCNIDAECPVSNNCGDVGPCRIENRGIVNFQNQFRSTSNGVCVDATMPTSDGTGSGDPEPVLVGGEPVGCLLNLNCALSGVPDALCLVGGTCRGGANPGARCTNATYEADCGAGGACDVEFSTELNGRPSESVFIQNHPFNFNSLPPFQPREYFYDFEIPAGLAPGTELVVAARIMNRHFPMRFLRNLIGTQVVRPPFLVEARGDPNDAADCAAGRTIDIDCFVRPLRILGNAEPGGFTPAVQTTRTRTVTIVP